MYLGMVHRNDDAGKKPANREPTETAPESVVAIPNKKAAMYEGFDGRQKV